MTVEEDPEGHELVAIAALLPSFASLHVVEIGCGDGRLTARYVHEAASVVAIDPDVEAIAELRAACPQVDARAITVDELALADASADLVLFAWSL